MGTLPYLIDIFVKLDVLSSSYNKSSRVVLSWIVKVCKVLIHIMIWASYQILPTYKKKLKMAGKAVYVMLPIRNRVR